jgi:hypothetical protein
MGNENDGVHGVQVGGNEPKALLLSDGTRLSLQSDGGAGGTSTWIRVGGEEADDHVSVTDAVELAGEEYAGYVQVRTRSEAAWLELISEWYAIEAARLRGDLDAAEEPVYAGSLD